MIMPRTGTEPTVEPTRVERVHQDCEELRLLLDELELLEDPPVHATDQLRATKAQLLAVFGRQL